MAPRTSKPSPTTLPPRETQPISGSPRLVRRPPHLRSTTPLSPPSTPSGPPMLTRITSLPPDQPCLSYRPSRPPHLRPPRLLKPASCATTTSSSRPPPPARSTSLFRLIRPPRSTRLTRTACHPDRLSPRGRHNRNARLILSGQPNHLSKDEPDHLPRDRPDHLSRDHPINLTP